MSRYSAYGKRESPWTQDGDPGFTAIDMLHDRGTLGSGVLARAENKRLRDGVAATRPGTAFPQDFNPAFENAIIGSGIFSNPNSAEVMLVATLDAGYVWALQYGADPVQIEIDASDVTQSTGTGLVHFCQAFDKVLMFRFPFGSQLPLVWDGVNGDKFVPVSTGGPHTLIPAVVTGVPYQNRLLLYSPYFPSVPWRDQFIMTDVLDYTQYDNVNSVFRINAGESDLITSVFPYFQQGVIVFMRNSVHILENFTTDPSLTQQRLLNGRLGSVGYQGPVQIGADIMFLSEPDGFYLVSQIIQELITTQPVPVSRPIQPIIDRINWDRANLYHSSAALGDYVYLAVPLDQKNGAADAVLVFNAVSGQWESAPDWWDDADFRINRLHVTSYGGSSPVYQSGASRVFGLDYAASRIYLLYEGLEDAINDDSLPVQDVMETRGYTAGDPGAFKRFERAVIGIRSFNPDGAVTAISDGYNEEKQIGTITKDRTRFYIHGHKPFNADTDDPTEPKREDYSVGNEDNVAIEDFEDLDVGDISFLPPTLLVFNAVKQQSLERRQIRQNGRWCSLRIENNGGQLDVLGVQVDAIPIQESLRTVA